MPVYDISSASKIMITQFLSICLYVFVLVAYTNAVLRKCVPNAAEILEFQVSGCPKFNKRCELVQGSTVNISVTFQPDTNSSDILVSLYATIGFSSKMLSDYYTDACKTGLNCPIRNGEIYMYNYSQQIPKFPIKKFPASLIFKLRNAKNSLNNIVCLQFDANFV